MVSYGIQIYTEQNGGGRLSVLYFELIK